MKDKQSNIGTKLSYLLVGGGIGAILALLFAPKAGQELRTDIADAARQGLDKTEEFAGQFGEKATAVFEDTKTKAGEFYESAKLSVNSAAAAMSEIPGDVKNEVQAKAEQISSSIEAGVKEFDREGEILERKAAATGNRSN